MKKFFGRTEAEVIELGRAEIARMECGGWNAHDEKMAEIGRDWIARCEKEELEAE